MRARCESHQSEEDRRKVGSRNLRTARARDGPVAVPGRALQINSIQLRYDLVVVHRHVHRSPNRNRKSATQPLVSHATTQGQTPGPRSAGANRKPRRERYSSLSTMLCHVIGSCSHVPSSPAPSGPASAAARARQPPLLHGTDAGIGSRAGPHGTAPSAQLLPFPLRPDLRRHARTPHVHERA